MCFVCVLNIRIVCVVGACSVRMSAPCVWSLCVCAQCASVLGDNPRADTEASYRELSASSSKTKCSALLTSAAGTVAVFVTVLVLGGSVTALVMTIQIGSISFHANDER